jgi:two-component system OmpR family sensor kinase
MSRVPIRLRVLVAFALAMALVLAGVGLYLYSSLGDDLAGGLDQDLRLHAKDLSVVSSEPGALRAEGGSRLIERGETFAQLLTPDGRVIEASPTLGRLSLLSAAQAHDTLLGARFYDRASVPGLNEQARLLATPVKRRGKPAVLVVGATLENRAEALRSLRTKLLIAGPVALLLAVGLGYLLAGSGLRAVEEMRRRAETISSERAGERLPVPSTGDELQRLGETLNEMLGRLEAALERERGFLAEAGHELRTPLALLRAELDFATHHAEDEAELRATVRAASEETDRLVQLAGDLLLIASSDQGGMALRTESITAADLLQSVRNRFAWRAEEAGRELIADVPDHLIVSGDRLRLEQALGNLVENALRHGEGAVAIEAKRADGVVELHVRDQGPGFPVDFLPRAFQRFSVAQESRSGGAGLGLAIVEAVARAHGGRAGAANPPSGGADVWVGLGLS